MSNVESGKDYISDIEQYNEWWNEGPSIELKEVIERSPRSDFHRILRDIDEYNKEGVESLIYPIFGQTGIGKTTMLKQFVAALIDTVDFPESGREHDFLSSANPRQVLYIPLEDSLYHLESPEDQAQELTQVVEYFRSRVAPRRGRKYIFLDDVNVLDLGDRRTSVLRDLVDEETYLILSGVVEDQVNLTVEDNADQIDEIHYNLPVLPMKFADTIGYPEDEGGLQVEFEADFPDQLRSYRSKGLSGSSPVKQIRLNLDLSGADLEGAVQTLEELYFEYIHPDKRDGLHDAARDYLRKGGILHRAKNASVRNDLVRSQFLLFLYKELAKYGSVQHPENLHRLCSFAARHAGEEVQYTDISDRIGVDRRTVDQYLNLLDEEGIVVTESQDFSLRRHRRTRLYPRNPRHAVLLSQRQEHYGFEKYEQQNVLNHEFEYKLARMVAFDHAKRLAFQVDAYDVEYCETDSGLVDYILHHDGLIVPFVLSYQPYNDAATQIAAEFDPSVGQHSKSDSEELRDLDYEAPYRFVITDNLSSEPVAEGSLVTERNGVSICYLPYWLFLLIC
jgi:predicted AAA+ superfamily ATPase